MRAARAAPALDGDRQNLPVPLGGMTPVRVYPRRRLLGRHARLRVPILGVGVVCGVFGLAMLLAPPALAVSLVGNRLEVGEMVLTSSGPVAPARPVLYQGEASYVLVERADGSATAAAVWVSGGVASTGVCRLHRDGARLVDECAFASGADRSTAVDVLDPARGPAWQRTYADGVRATIPVSPDGSAVPVAFPIGR